VVFFFDCHDALTTRLAPGILSLTTVPQSLRRPFKKERPTMSKVNKDERELIEGGNKLAAIIAFRARTGSELKEAVDAAEAVSRPHQFTAEIQSGRLDLPSGTLARLSIQGLIDLVHMSMENLDERKPPARAHYLDSRWAESAVFAHAWNEIENMLDYYRMVPEARP
jgi:hypothetical protein